MRLLGLVALLVPALKKKSDERLLTKSSQHLIRATMLLAAIIRTPTLANLGGDIAAGANLASKTRNSAARNASTGARMYIHKSAKKKAEHRESQVSLPHRGAYQTAAASPLAPRSSIAAARGSGVRKRGGSSKTHPHRSSSFHL